jgi:hypothetical protein
MAGIIKTTLQLGVFKTPLQLGVSKTPLQDSKTPLHLLAHAHVYVCDDIDFGLSKYVI